MVFVEGNATIQLVVLFQNRLVDLFPDSIIC